MVDVAIRYGWSLGTGEVLIIRNLEWGRGGYSVLTKIYLNVTFLMKDSFSGFILFI